MYSYLPKWGGPKGGPADAVIKRGEDKCSSTVIIEHGGDVYEITRQRPVKLQVKKNGEIQEGKVADLDKRMSQMIGMSDNQFLLAVYMPQKRSSSFFNMSDSDRTELLSKVAGLEELDTALVRVKAKRNELTLEAERNKATIAIRENMLVRIPAKMEESTSELKKQMKEMQDAIDMDNHIRGDAEDHIKTIQAESKRVIQGILLTTDEQVSGHETNLRQLNEKYTALNSELSTSPRPSKHLFDDVESYRSVLSEREGDNRKRLVLINTNERLQQKIIEELDMMEAASKGKCNHCKQDLSPADKEQASLRHMKNAQKCESDMVTIPAEIDLTPFKENLENAVIALNTAKTQLAERPLQLKIEMESVVKAMKDEQSFIDMKRTSGRNEMEHIRSKAESNVQTIRNELATSNNKIQNLQKFVDHHLVELQKLEKQQKEDTEALNEDKIRLASVLGDSDELLDLIDLFGPKGFRTLCFEDLIARISDRAGQLLSVMTEGLYSTRIEQAGETGKGDHRVMLRPVITRGGLEVPQDDLSGGAEATVTLNYDVAISEAIAENSPLFLDEALDGLDAIGKAEAIRLLEEVARTRPVFLIDHTDSIKSSVQNVITITYKNDTSSMENTNEDSNPASITG